MTTSLQDKVNKQIEKEFQDKREELMKRCILARKGLEDNLKSVDQCMLDIENATNIMELPSYLPFGVDPRS